MALKRKLSVQSSLDAFFIRPASGDQPTSKRREDLSPKDTEPPSATSFSTATELIQRKDSRGRTYQSSWETEFTWLEYNPGQDKATCSICCRAVQENLISSREKNKIVNKYPKWITGYDNWNKGIKAIRVHANSILHQQCHAAVISVSQASRSADIISTQAMQTLRKNRIALEAIFDVVLLIGKQGLAYRGHTDEGSNLRQILLLLGTYSTEVNEWLQRPARHKWLSHDVQNEMIQLMSHSILRSELEKIKTAKWFSIMVDETTDVAVNEQVSICARYVDPSFNIHEVFLGFATTALTDAATLHGTIKNCLIALGLDLSFCRGQAYDGASNMRGRLSGVQQRFKENFPKMIFVYCAGHQINLVVQDAFSATREGQNALATLKAVSNFIVSSPKRLSNFKDFKLSSSDSDPSLRRNGNLRPLCPTRWVLRYAALDTFLSQYKSILDWLEALVLDASIDNSSKGQARAFLGSLEKFQTYYMLRILHHVLRFIHPLHVTLQGTSITIGYFRSLLENVVGMLSGATTDNLCDAFYKTCTDFATDAGIGQPALPRRVGSRSSRLERDENSGTEFGGRDCDLKSHHFALFKEVFQQATKSILERYPAESLHMTVHMANLFSQRDFALKESVTKIESAYESDLDLVNGDLEFEIQALQIHCRQRNISMESIESAHSLFVNDSTMPRCFPNLSTILRIYLTLPVTTCQAERSFSMLRRVKTYLRSTMSQQRLNHVCILNVYKTEVESLIHTKSTIIDEWINQNQIRRNVFATSRLIA